MKTLTNTVLPDFLEDRNQAYDLVRTAYRDWERLKNDSHFSPAVALTLVVGLNIMDLHEATMSALLTISPEADKELDFVSKAACRILALRIFEQRAALYRLRGSVEKIMSNEKTKIDYSSFEKLCQANKEDLLYAESLSTIRNAVGHYNSNHADIINLIDQIDPVKLIDASAALLRCYTGFSDVLEQIQKIKIESAK